MSDYLWGVIMLFAADLTISVVINPSLTCLRACPLIFKAQRHLSLSLFAMFFLINTGPLSQRLFDRNLTANRF